VLIGKILDCVDDLPTYLNAACVSRTWRVCVEMRWVPFILERWPLMTLDHPPPLPDAPAREQGAYASWRHMTDGVVLHALQEAACSPMGPAPALRRIAVLTGDAFDVLTRAAEWSHPRLLGLRYWAAVALCFTAGMHSVAPLEEIVMSPTGGGTNEAFQAALLIVRGAGFWLVPGRDKEGLLSTCILSFPS
jgi:hypothetical protein